MKNTATINDQSPMIQTLVIITEIDRSSHGVDLDKTYREGRLRKIESVTVMTTLHDLAECSQTARTMFAKELNDDRYTVEIIPVPSLELESIAMDDSRGPILRRRAITLLSQLPSEQNLNFLKSLNTLEVEGLRSMAVDTIGLVYGETHSDVVTQAIEVALKDTELEVRKSAVRALGWTSGERASTLLAELVNDKELSFTASLTIRAKNHPSPRYLKISPSTVTYF